MIVSFLSCHVGIPDRILTAALSTITSGLLLNVKPLPPTLDLNLALTLLEFAGAISRGTAGMGAGGSYG